jgi:hypothetical protein
MLTPYEYTALAQYLCNIPQDKCYITILNLITGEIEDEEECITIWEPFEAWDKWDLRQLIEDLKYTLEENFIPKEK